MTYEEVKKIREQHYVDSEDDFFEASRMVGIAIEKQIPKKPNKGREYGFEWDECPVCKCGIDEWNEDEMCGNLFCPRCGQAINWRSEEECE